MISYKKLLCVILVIVFTVTINKCGGLCSSEKKFKAQTIDEMTREESLKRVRKSKSTVILFGAAFLGVHAGRRDSLELYREQHAIQKNALEVYREIFEDDNEIE